MRRASTEARERGGQGAFGTFGAMLVAVLVALSIRCFLCEVFQIPSGSMIPTLQVGDRILVNKLLYGPRFPFTGRRLWALWPPRRGEVAVFLAPGRGQDYIKRIIALPGDTVEVRAGRVILNDAAMPRIPLGPTTCDDREEHSGIWHPLHAQAFVDRFDPAAPSRGGGDAPLAAGFTVLRDREQGAEAHDMRPVRVPAGHVFVMGDNRDHSSDSRDWGFVPLGALLGRASFVLFSWGKGGLTFERSGHPVHPRHDSRPPAPAGA